MVLLLLFTVMELLRGLAGGGGVELFVVNLIAGRLDPLRRVKVYLRLSED